MLRDDVLLLLTEAEGYLSGEEMREKLGVSRAAVSQAVRARRADGYDIGAVTNRGYCLRARPDTLTAGDVLSYLPEARRATVQCFAQIDSTNSYLKAEAMRGAPDGLCAIADRQTAGRGRAGRPFRSDAGQGVYLSMLLRPHCAPTAAMTMTAHVAVAVCRALEACGVQPGIKWTNDLVLGTKKLCGILTELTVEAETGTVDSIVAGIGVNVRQRPEDFPPELRTIAGSVRSETGLEISRARLAAEMVRALDQMYLDWQRDPRAYLDDYRARCVTVGRPVRVVRGEGCPDAKSRIPFMRATPGRWLQGFSPRPSPCRSRVCSRRPSCGRRRRRPRRSRTHPPRGSSARRSCCGRRAARGS